MTSRKNVRREECVKSRASELSTRRAVKIQRCQEQSGSKECGIMRKGWQEKEMPRTKSSQQIIQSTALTTRRSGKLRSYRLFLFFVGFRPIETSVTRLVRALLVMSWTLYILSMSISNLSLFLEMHAIGWKVCLSFKFREELKEEYNMSYL